jgi:hypothetical protein
MDCIADVSGELAFFELKDKEFNLGSAYSFGAKIGIVRPQHPVVVTTEHVGGDAKEHFERAREPRVRRYRSALDQDRQREVRYIEGIENLSARLGGIVGEIYKRDAQNILDELVPFATPAGSTLVEIIAGGVDGASDETDKGNVSTRKRATSKSRRSRPRKRSTQAKFKE